MADQSVSARAPEVGTGQIQVCGFGDSLTNGSQADATDYGPVLQLAARPVFSSIRFRQLGVNSAQIQAGSAAGNNLPDRWTKIDQFLYDASRAKNIARVWIGTNDLASLRTAAQAWADLSGYLDSLIAQGWFPIVGTCIPRNCGGNQASFDANRPTFNASVNGGVTQTGKRFDPVDYTTLPEFNTVNAYLTVANYNADGVHLSNFGYKRIADADEIILRAVINR